jgi:hypothetical protein
LVLLPVDELAIPSALAFTSLLAVFQVSSWDMLLEDKTGDSTMSDAYLK